jgi:hypothetical protein
MPSEPIAIVLAPSRSGVRLPSGTSPQLITLRKKVDAAMALAADVMYHGAWSRDLFIAARDQAYSWSWKCDTQEPGYTELMEALGIAQLQASLNNAVVDRRNADDRRRSYYMGSFIDTRAPGANAAMRAFAEADGEVHRLQDELQARLSEFSRMPAVSTAPSKPRRTSKSKSSNPSSKIKSRVLRMKP